MRTADSLSLLLIPSLLLAVTVSYAATLTGFAELPADTFRPGPTSGQFIEATNQRRPPFVSRQPVQGFSALIKGPEESYYVLSDNGFGRRDNSRDYILSIYQLEPDFRTASGGTGEIRLLETITLSDPDGYLPYPVSRPQDRLLTGADLDPESFRRLSNGSFWIGEEFSPSLVHFSQSGQLLAAPFTLKGLSSVDNPQGVPATLPRSRGFEGMALSADQRWLYPILEGALMDAEPGLNIYTFDIEKQRFLNQHANQPGYRYRLDETATAIGDFTMFSETGGLLVERDSAQGGKAVTKKIYHVDFDHLDDEGYLRKTLVADLLQIDDPYDLDRDGSTVFRFPFWTIEGLVVVSRDTLGIVNDNNYPFGQARDHGAEIPDNNEFILIQVAPLWD